MDRSNDLRAFCDFAAKQLLSVGAVLSLDEALDRWEHENSTETEREETISAIRLGLEEMEAGRTEDAFAFVERMRRKFRQPGQP